MIFAFFILERDPLQLSDLASALVTWSQNAGTYALLGILLVALSLRLRGARPIELGLRTFPLGIYAIFVSFALLAGLAVLYLLSAFGWSRIGAEVPYPETRNPQTVADYVFGLAGFFAVLAAVAPLFQVRFQRLAGRRVWAFAILSWKEAIRSKILWIFMLVAVIFLFLDWFVPYKPENQIRAYVQVLYWSVYAVFFATAGLLGSFSIPSDIQNLTIHTIVTKPVQKFEIVLGRILGYGMLLTVCLAGLTLLSLIYIWRGVTEEARKESLTARVVEYGDLAFLGTKARTEGVSVGNIFEYRSHISGPHPSDPPGKPIHYAVWAFRNELPGLDAARIQFQFTFDVFRLRTGKVDRGVYCNFWFVDGRHPEDKVESLVQAMQKEQASGRYKMEEDGYSPELARKFRIAVIPSFEVKDNHTQELEVPGKFFQMLRELERSEPRKDAAVTPFLRVFVSVDRNEANRDANNSQLIGMNRRDFFMLEGSNSFTLNFIKGMIGVWFSFMLVLILSVVLSTYLSGVISMLTTLVLIAGGLLLPFLTDLVENRVHGAQTRIDSGPAVSFYRLFTNTPLVATPDDTPGATLMRAVDNSFRFVLRKIMILIPDIDRYNLEVYVANGFDISWTQILLMDNLLPFAAYVLPWLLLAYYLINFREIANPT